MSEHIIQDDSSNEPPNQSFDCDALWSEITKLRAEAERACTWTEDEDGPWITGCGHAFEFNTDGPKENGFQHCCYCGGKLIIKEGGAE